MVQNYIKLYARTAVGVIGLWLKYEACAKERKRIERLFSSLNTYCTNERYKHGEAKKEYHKLKTNQYHRDNRDTISSAKKILRINKDIISLIFL